MADRAFTCRVCNEAMNRHTLQPVSLGCGHTFCRRCLIRINMDEVQLRCPTCRKYHPGRRPEELPINFALLSVIEANQKSENTNEKQGSNNWRWAGVVIGGAVALAVAPFVLAGVGVTSAGMAAGSLAAAVANGGGVVAGGAIAGAAGVGAAAGGLIANNLAGENGAAGIGAAAGGLIANNLAGENGAAGIGAAAGGLIANNLAGDNGAAGIGVAAGGLTANNLAGENGAEGIGAAAGGLIANNLAGDNGAERIGAAAGGLIANNLAGENGAAGNNNNGSNGGHDGRPSDGPREWTIGRPTESENLELKGKSPTQKRELMTKNYDASVEISRKVTLFKNVKH